MTYPQPAKPQSKPKTAWFLVLGAAVLGVLLLCGITVNAIGNDEQPPKELDAVAALATTTGPATSTASAVTEAATTAPATQAPTTAAAPTTPAAKATTAVPKQTTKPAPKPTTKAPAPSNCNPNYSPCVPNASDVDCAGGSGDGPAYVKGPVKVIGTDVYRLDHDKDGIGCE